MKKNGVILDTEAGDKRGRVDWTRGSVTGHHINRLAMGTGR